MVQARGLNFLLFENEVEQEQILRVFAEWEKGHSRNLYKVIKS